MKKLALILCLFLLAACDGGDQAAPLVLVATPDAPDAGFRTYTHPSGVFSVRVPPSWIPDQLPDENGLRVQFTSVEGDKRVVRLTVYVVNTGQPLTGENFVQAVNAYQPPPDVAAVPWTPLTDTAAMPDGSLRLTGLRHYPTLGTRALNLFFQSNGGYFSALEVDVTDADSAVMNTVTAAVNTYRVNTAMPLEVGTVTQGGVTSASGIIGFENYVHWQDGAGGFNITGQIVNRSEVALEAVRLTAYLYDMEGNLLGERSDVLAYDVLAGGEKAPFRLRFDTGRPTTAVRYELHAAARGAEFALATFYGNENFLIAQDSADYNTSGYLAITGLIQNSGGFLAQDVKIIATIYNAEGQIVGAESTFIREESLLPGQSTDFEITFVYLGGDPFRYTLVAQGTTAN